MVEMYFQFQSDSGLMDETHALRRWSQAYLNSLSQAYTPQCKKDRHAPQRLEAMMANAGFVDINMRIKNVPMSPWSEGMMPYPVVDGSNIDGHQMSLKDKLASKIAET